MPPYNDQDLALFTAPTDRVQSTNMRIERTGRAIALAGVVIPLLLIGLLKFTAIEVEALKPVIGGTPWLSWLYLVFGETGASWLLGIVEIATAALLLASVRYPKAGLAGGFLGALTFAVTVSTMLALPIWEEGSGGFPFLNFLGSFLVKDIALLGVSLVILGESLARLK
ncbi:DUF417 family protein [Aurantimonas sp. HBX-1]|uniref:DUF417 family protein n=1 Tax=Aurantimonas sp. HBX-1 TaxID=2906072 RepID=UPI001F3570E3|nr:DUF417 family protein [Aurantimonas sp. HBX-1]UIJ73450.1 DUF417 family protein [Aurantimonas sp. HBX-1]